MARKPPDNSPPTGYENIPPEALTAAELGALADSYHGLDERVADLNRQVREAESERGKVRRYLIAALYAHNLVSVGGALATVSRVPKLVPKVADWTALYAHIRATGEFELLHKRVTEDAVRERWANEEVVPGVAAEPVDALSVSTIAARRANAT